MAVIRPFAFVPGDRVVYFTHTRDHGGWVGVVCGREWYEDFDGSGNWYYVRWIEPEGEVHAEKQRLAERELRKEKA